MQVVLSVCRVKTKGCTWHFNEIIGTNIKLSWLMFAVVTETNNIFVRLSASWLFVCVSQAALSPLVQVFGYTNDMQNDHLKRSEICTVHFIIWHETFLSVFVCTPFTGLKWPRLGSWKILIRMWTAVECFILDLIYQIRSNHTYTVLMGKMFFYLWLLI